MMITGGCTKACAGVMAWKRFHQLGVHTLLRCTWSLDLES